MKNIFERLPANLPILHRTGYLTFNELQELRKTKPESIKSVKIRNSDNSRIFEVEFK